MSTPTVNWAFLNNSLGEFADVAMTGATDDPEWPVTNLIKGGRGQFFRDTIKQTSMSVVFDLGTNVNKPSRIALLGIGKTLQQGLTSITVTVEGDDNSAFTTPQTDTPTAITTANLVGPTREDYFEALTFAGANEQYWRVGLTAVGGTPRFLFEKLFLGNFTQIGVDPMYPISVEFIGSSNYPRRQRRRYSISFDGVTNANRKTFENEFLDKPDQFDCILSDGGFDAFSGDTISYGRIINHTMSPIAPDRWQIDLTVDELI